MTETQTKPDLLDLLLMSIASQTVLVAQAHKLVGFDSESHQTAACTTPAELSRQVSELAVSARETAANTASSHSARGRQLDYLHAQSGALVQLTERYITQVRQQRSIQQQLQQGSALGYADVATGLRVESAAHGLAAAVDVLESFILAIRAAVHQSVAIVTREMASAQ